MKVISFLAALGPQSESTKNQLLTNAELPTLNATFLRFSWISLDSNQSGDQEESVAISATALPVSSSTRGRGKGRGASGRRDEMIGTVTFARNKITLKTSVDKKMESQIGPIRKILN